MKLRLSVLFIFSGGAANTGLQTPKQKVMFTPRLFGDMIVIESGNTLKSVAKLRNTE